MKLVIAVLISCLSFSTWAGMHAPTEEEEARKIALELARQGARDPASFKEDEAEFQNAVRRRLRDPSSAVFGDFTKFGKDDACLNINAKNYAGKYAGWKVLLVSRNGERWTFQSTPSPFLWECKLALEGEITKP